jgi:hypothetical protein
VPADRLTVKDGVILFKADGQYRSKIGLPPSRALAIAGSYDAAAHVLTLVQYTRPADAREYVNSMWEIQREPYKGDVVNSYNDGPPAPGKPPLGPFYELETSSPALALAPGRRLTSMRWRAPRSRFRSRTSRARSGSSSTPTACVRRARAPPRASRC